MYHPVLATSISYWNLSLPPWPYRFSFLLNSSIPSWTLTFLVRPITPLWNLPLAVGSYHSSLNSSIPSLTLHLLISFTIPSRTIYIITPCSLLFLIRPYHSSLICTLPSRTLHSWLNLSVTSWTLPSPSLNSVIPSWALPVTKSYHSLHTQSSVNHCPASGSRCGYSGVLFVCSILVPLVERLLVYWAWIGLGSGGNDLFTVLHIFVACLT